MDKGAPLMAPRPVYGRIEPAMPKRYVVKPGAKMGGVSTFDVVDTQDGAAVHNSFLKSECLKRAKKYNAQETAIPGGFNKRHK